MTSTHSTGTHSTSTHSTGHPKYANADHEVVDLIRERWSPRAFDTARPVTGPDLARLFEAARWAPSSSNQQPWRFVVTHRDDDPEPYQALLGALSRSNQLWAGAAPVLVLTALRLTLDGTDDANHYSSYDTGQAVAFLTIQAQAQGLAIRQMAGFNRALATAACQIPEGFEPAVVMAIGYPGSPEQLESEKHRASEQAPRQRRALSEFVFHGTWGSTFR